MRYMRNKTRIKGSSVSRIGNVSERQNIFVKFIRVGCLNPKLRRDYKIWIPKLIYTRWFGVSRTMLILFIDGNRGCPVIKMPNHFSFV